MASEAVTEQDIAYYIDDQLDPIRRVEIEAHLARNPAEAARVMGDLRITHELRLAMAGDVAAPVPETGDMARRLNGSLLRRSFFHRLRPALAACLLVTAGAVGGLLLPRPDAAPMMPDYVEAALQAHTVSQMRAMIPSQPEAPEYDSEELLSATAIEMPTLPADWIVTDVQIYPSRFGPSVEMAVIAGDLGPTSIFAARPGRFNVLTPTVETQDGTTLSHWQIGEVAYVLVGTPADDEILTAAEELARTLF